MDTWSVHISLVERLHRRHLVKVVDYEPKYREQVIQLANRAFNYSKDSYWASRDLDICDKAFLAIADNKVVGTVELGFIKLRNSMHAQVGYIFVDPDYRHVGVGSALLSRAIEFLKEKRVKAVWALTSPQNFATRSLFKKFGFREFTSPKELKKILSSKDIRKLLYKLVYWEGDIILYLALN